MYNDGLSRDYGLTTSAYKQGVVTSPAKGWYSMDGGKTKQRAADLTKALSEKIESGEIK